MADVTSASDESSATSSLKFESGDQLHVSSLKFEPGDQLHITHEATGHSTILLIEPSQQTDALLLSLPERPFHRLFQSDQKASNAVHFKHSKGHGAALWRIDVGSDGRVRIRPWRGESFLAFDASGTWCLATSESRGRWLRGTGTGTGRAVHSDDGDEADPATRFARDGYCLLPDLLPPQKVRRALRYLNYHLGSADLALDVEPDGLGMQFNRAVVADLATGDEDVPKGVVKLGGGRTCACRLSQGAPLIALLDETTRDAICEAIAPRTGGLKEAPRRLSAMFGVQVALRFPMPPFAAGVTDGDDALPGLLSARGASSGTSGAASASGLDWHTDAAKYNAKKTFDLVVGLFLTDVLLASDGALWVQPGSHIAEKHARESGALPPRALCTDGAMATDPLSAAARPILARAGTAIVFDGDLVHAGGPNLSSGIRHALYARMRFERAAAEP